MGRVSNVARLIILAGIVAGGACTAAAQTAPTNGWQLTWSDEFEGTTLNPLKWTANNAPGNTNNELQYYSPQNVTVTGGEMVIKSEQRNVGGRIYASGLVKTVGKFSQQYGRFESRMKLPKTQGIWPAFWMLPTDGGWPPEIDIMELLGHQPNVVYMTNHWGVWPNNADWSTPFAGPDFSAGYHTFAVEWAPGRCDWYIDGIKRTTHNANIPDEPFYLIINTAVGGQWPGNPDGTTVFPQYMNVQHVRAYRQNLINATMEDWGPTGNTALADWVGFGIRAVDNTSERSGAWCAKISTWANPGNLDSGLYQEFAVRPGQVWRASSWWRNPTASALTGTNVARLDLEWFDSAGVPISVDTRTALTSASPKDIYIQSTLQAQAPAGAAKARFVLKVIQNGTPGGSVFVDDADLQLVTTNAGFEDLGPAGNVGLYGWLKVGNTFDSPLFPRTGTRGGKLYGRFTGSPNVSTASQDFAVRPGDVWSLGSWWYNASSDFMRGSNTAGPVLEWRDSRLNLLGTTSVTALSASSPQDKHTLARVMAVAPPGAVWGRAIMNFSQPGSDAGAAFVDDVNLVRMLANSSVDDFGPGGDIPLYGWNSFGASSAPALNPRTGTNAGKLFGNFSGPYNTSGVFQDLPVEPGQRWHATAWWFNASNDYMRGLNETFTNIEWRDAAGNLIHVDSAPALNAASPQDSYQRVDVAGIAPAGAATARLVMLFIQAGSDTGAAFYDDVTFDLETPCVADLDLDGNVDLNDFFEFLNAFDVGGADADVDGSGIVDLSDFFAFLNWFDSGC